MTLDSATHPPSVATRRRLPGPDVVRGVALIGVVVMNYHGYLLIDGGGDTGSGWAADLFNPWTGPLSTRFAATFVLVAGVGVTLMTNRARQDSSATRYDAATAHDTRDQRNVRTAMRWRLVRRGVVLYAGGVALDAAWPGTIIPFYGGMFVLAAVMFTWRSRWLVTTGVVAAALGWGLRVWRFDRAEAGESTTWLTSPPDGSPQDYVFGLWINGTHPLLPWLAFFCAGMVLGRVLHTDWWRPIALIAGTTMFGMATVISDAASTPWSAVALSTDPLDRGGLYVLSALGTALLAYGLLDWCAERLPRATSPLRIAGQMTLSLYLLHILVYYICVDWLGWIEPAGLDVALTFALCFWVSSIAAAAVWERRFGRGPAERAYRVLGG
ncbi:MAG: DUF418 domain-containing protein [Actinomycetota bacterium]